MKELDQHHLDPDQVQATMKHIHEHLQVGMGQSQTIQKEGANREQTPAATIHEGSQV
jgi:hypothetical protein